MLIKNHIQVICIIFLTVALLPTVALGGNNLFGKLLNDIAKTSLAPKAATPNSKADASSNKGVGTIAKAANLRYGPGTNNSIMTTLPEGTNVYILDKKDSWYQVQAVDSQTSGWVSSSLVALESSSNLASSSTSSNTTKGNTTNVDYAGYSADYQKVREMQVSGNLKGINDYYAYAGATQSSSADPKNSEGNTNNSEAENLDVLRLLERGTLSIDQGDYDRAVADFTGAEGSLDEKDDESKAVGLFKKVGSFTAGMITGNEEFGAYRGEGWERVLMLNYKSLALLLQGDRRAYNVTRRAIDWQNIEKKAFDQKMQEEKEKLKEEEAKLKEQEGQKQNIQSGIGAVFAAMDAKASSVPSAYVNPFGFYVAGMVQEFESYDDRSLRDNARISYTKALELNPASEVLKKAVTDLEKAVAPEGTRLVHVVVADGFAPEKKVLAYNVNVDNSVIPLKMPIYEPVQSKVHRIEVRSTTGERLATCSSISDIEAICLRQQKDLQSISTMRAMTSFFATAAVEGLTKNTEGIGGLLMKSVASVRKKSSAPDTRSWMSLPSTIQAARLQLPKGVSQIVIQTFDQNGKKLASKSVKINKNGHDFVYARSIGNILLPQKAGQLWLAGL